MTTERKDAPIEPPTGPERAERDDGPLLDPLTGDRLEEDDRKRPIPGGEPTCPLCGAEMVRHVEKPPAPRGGRSPFRVRLVCASEECGAWTVYDW
jgi:hypothetical protein